MTVQKLSRRSRKSKSTKNAELLPWPHPEGWQPSEEVEKYRDKTGISYALYKYKLGDVGLADIEDQMYHAEHDGKIIYLDFKGYNLLETMKISQLFATSHNSRPLEGRGIPYVASVQELIDMFKDDAKKREMMRRWGPLIIDDLPLDHSNIECDNVEGLRGVATVIMRRAANGRTTYLNLCGLPIEDPKVQVWGKVGSFLVHAKRLEIVRPK